MLKLLVASLTFTLGINKYKINIYSMIILNKILVVSLLFFLSLHFLLHLNFIFISSIFFFGRRRRKKKEKQLEKPIENNLITFSLPTRLNKPPLKC